MFQKLLARIVDETGSLRNDLLELEITWLINSEVKIMFENATLTTQSAIVLTVPCFVDLLAFVLVQ